MAESSQSPTKRPVVKFSEQDAEEFVKNSYSEAIPEFKEQLSEIAAQGGYTIEQIQQRFSNSLWDNIIFQN